MIASWAFMHHAYLTSAGPRIKHAMFMVLEAVEWINATFPYWQRAPKKHIFTFPHDGERARCRRTCESVAKDVPAYSNLTRRRVLPATRTQPPPHEAPSAPQLPLCTSSYLRARPYRCLVVRGSSSIDSLIRRCSAGPQRARAGPQPPSRMPCGLRTGAVPTSTTCEKCDTCGVLHVCASCERSAGLQSCACDPCPTACLPSAAGARRPSSMTTTACE
jgi:hypothetical protein